MKLKKIIILLFLVSAGSLSTKAQWQKIGLEGGSISALYNFENKLFLGTNEKSVLGWKDGNWKDIVPKEIANVTGFVKSKNTLLISDTKAGTFKSENDGLSWSKVIIDTFTNYNSNLVFIANNRLFLNIPGDFTLKGHLFISNDLGKTWSNQGTGLPSLLSSNNIKYFDEYYYLFSNAGLYRKSEQDSAWKKFETGFTIPGEFISGVPIFIIKFKNELIAATTVKGLFKYNDTLGKWQKRPWNLLDTVLRAGLLNYKGCLLTCINNERLVISDTMGNNWQYFDHGLESGFINSIELINDTLFLGGLKGLFFRTYNDSIWKSFNTGLNMPNVVSAANLNQRIIVANSLGSIIEPTPNQITLLPKVSNLPSSISLNQMTPFGNRFFCATTKGLFRTHEFGGEWLITDTFTKSLNVGKIAVGGSQFLLITSNGKAYTTDTSDFKWKLNTGPGKTTNRIIFIENKYYAATNGGLYQLDAKDSIWKIVSGTPTEINNMDTMGGSLICTTNRGISIFNINLIKWTRLNNDLSNIPCKLIRVINGNLLVDRTDNRGFYLSSDTGQTFQLITDNITNLRVQEILLINDTVWLATNKGLWFKPYENLTLSTPKNNLIEAKINLYPNPTKGTLIIESNKPISYIEIYNLKGELLQNWKEPNSNSKIFELNHYNAGLYFMKLTYKDGFETRKFMVE